MRDRIRGRGLVAAQECARRADGKSVAADGVGQPPLFGFSECQKRMRRRERKLAAIEPRLKFRCQSADKRQPTLHPAFGVSQKLHDPGKRQAVLIGQGRNHARFVHGACGLGRSVGLEQPRF